MFYTKNKNLFFGFGSQNSIQRRGIGGQQIVKGSFDTIYYEGIFY